MDAAESIRDDLLALRCQAGDARAFDLLVSRWQEPLLHYAYRLTGNRVAAQDVAQETWIVVIRGLVALRDVARFKPWLFRIASHKCADYWRRNKRADEFARDLSQELGDAETASPARSGWAEDLASAFKHLPPDSRTVLALKYLEDFSVGEIAEILSLPEGTVKSRLHHARQQLRNRMEEDDGPH